MEYINIEKTLNELGTDIKKLKPNSEKLVYRICKICKKENIKKYRHVVKLKQHMCLNCSNKINANKNLKVRNEKIKQHWLFFGHPRLGKFHSLKSKIKMSNSKKGKFASIKTKEKLSKANSGKNNPMYGKKHTEETKNKLRQIALKNARRGKDCNFYGKTYYTKRTKYTAKNGKIYDLKSSWELKIAIHLDEKNIKWEYEKQFYPVKYEYEGVLKEGTYIPDFFVNDEIWEVKGYWRKDALIKFETFKKTYPKLKIKLLRKNDLKNMGIKI